MAFFRALNPPQTVKVTVGHGSLICAHVFEDNQTHVVDDGHDRCLKMLRMSPLFEEV